jgi:hypothetical protein
MRDPRRSWAPLLALWAAACAEPDAGLVYPDPGDGPALRGPGGPAVAFADDALWSACATLEGGERDYLHHNLVVPYRGHLLMPWSPEFGTGGLSLFDVSDPCAPVLAGEGWDQSMRETHAIGLVHLPDSDPHAGDYAAVNGVLGVQLWDLSVTEEPVALSYLTFEGVFYPDAYARVVLSVSWQYPWLYVAAADNGVFVVDATDPAAPVHVATYTPEPLVRVGGVFAQGPTLLLSSAEQDQALMLDISTPDAPQAVAGGQWQTSDADGEPREHYHGSRAGDLALFARKEDGGGVMVYDIADPGAPAFLGDYNDPSGNGGYAWYDEGTIFLGSSSFADVLDASDLSAITRLGTADLAGDLDTVTPYGNVAVLSVDEDAEDGVATALVPWRAAPDGDPPEVRSLAPFDGQQGVATTTCVGVGFNEFIEPSSVHLGSLRLLDEEGAGVDGWGSGQEATAHFCPKAPLQPGVRYTLSVEAGGIADLNGNAVAETVQARFQTAGGGR